MKMNLNSEVNTHKKTGRVIFVMMLKTLSFVLMFFGVSLNLCWAADNTGPKMIIEEKLFEMGEVKEGSTIEHAFKILNAGDAPLILTKVKPG